MGKSMPVRANGGNMLVKVASHPRSGTHLLMAYLKAHFYGDVDLSKQCGQMCHWSYDAMAVDYSYLGYAGEDVRRVAWARLFGSHAFAGRYRDTSRVVYIYRNPEDVVMSLHRMRFFRHRDQAGIAFKDYLGLSLDWTGFPGRKTKNGGMSVEEHIARHQEGWLGSDALCVKYEDLVRDPELVLSDIETQFDLSLMRPVRRIVTTVGYVNGKGTADARDDERAAWNR